MNESSVNTTICSTPGKMPLLSVTNGGPGLWARGEGAQFWDTFGKCWLDCDLCLGSIVWGHGRREIAEAVSAQVFAGSAPSVPSAIEAEATEALLARLNRYESVCFFKTGAETCTAAVRLARCVTGRDHILCDGFHGWHDWSIGGAYPNERKKIGVPADVQALAVTIDPILGLEPAFSALQSIRTDIAAAVFRPEAWDPDVLQAIVAEARCFGAIVICDEVTSHLKYSRAGSAAQKGVNPDMICIAKGLANGLPLSALLGPRYILDQVTKCKISSTNSSETASLAAMLAAEMLMDQTPMWPSWQLALKKIVDRTSTILTSKGMTGFTIVSHPGFFSIERAELPFKNDPFRRHFVAELGVRGIYTRGWIHGSDMHDEKDWRRIEEAVAAALLSWNSHLNNP